MATGLNLHNMRDWVAKHYSKTAGAPESKVAPFIDHKHPSLLLRPAEAQLVLATLLVETANAVSAAALKARFLWSAAARSALTWVFAIRFGLDVTKTLWFDK